MSAMGRQLLIVSSAEVIERAKRFGTRVTAELCPVAGGSRYVARIVMSHALLPGKRAALGLLFVESAGSESVVVAGATIDDTEAAVRAALPMLASRLHCVASNVPGELYGGDAAVPGLPTARAA